MLLFAYRIRFGKLSFEIVIYPSNSGILFGVYIKIEILTFNIII